MCVCVRVLIIAILFLENDYLAPNAPLYMILRICVRVLILLILSAVYCTTNQSGNGENTSVAGSYGHQYDEVKVLSSLYNELAMSC